MVVCPKPKTLTWAQPREGKVFYAQPATSARLPKPRTAQLPRLSLGTVSVSAEQPVNLLSIWRAQGADRLEQGKVIRRKIHFVLEIFGEEGLVCSFLSLQK